MRSSLALVLVACGGTAVEEAAVTYNRDVYPIAAEHCIGCHTEGGIAPMSFEDAASLVRARLEEAVRLRVVRSDVPVGCYLSGEDHLDAGVPNGA